MSSAVLRLQESLLLLGLLRLPQLGLFLLGGRLFLKGLCLHTFGLGLVDGFHQHALVLELVTLGCNIEFVVQMPVDLFLLAILAEKTAQNTKTADPQNLGRHSCLCGTAALSCAGVATLALGFE